MKREQQQGSAILTVLGIVSVVSIVCGFLGFAATQQMRAAQITREMLKARLIAESGLNKAYHEVKTDYYKLKSYSAAGTFGGGTYKVTATTSLGGSENRAQLVSEGVCGMGRAVVSADLENAKKKYALDEFVRYDLHTGGVLYLSGTVDSAIEAMFANSGVKISGSTVFEGSTTISTTGEVTEQNNRVTGDYVPQEGQTLEAFPSELWKVIDTLKGIAKNNDAVYASGADIPSSPPGGVALCTGSADGWNGGTGTFIFMGEVSLQGSGLSINSENGYPALVVLSTSDVRLNADAMINGAVWIPNANLKINGHADFYGLILVGQSMTGNGTADLHAGELALPDYDNVIITAWH